MPAAVMPPPATKRARISDTGLDEERPVVGGRRGVVDRGALHLGAQVVGDEGMVDAAFALEALAVLGVAGRGPGVAQPVGGGDAAEQRMLLAADRDVLDIVGR